MWINAVKVVLSKESLNSDGQQFHQHQQDENHLSPQNIEYKKDHNIWHWKSRSWLGTDIQMWHCLNSWWNLNSVYIYHVSFSSQKLDLRRYRRRNPYPNCKALHFELIRVFTCLNIGEIKMVDMSLLLNLCLMICVQYLFITCIVI